MKKLLTVIAVLLCSALGLIGFTYAAADEIHRHSPHECKRNGKAHACHHVKTAAHTMRADDGIDPAPDCYPCDTGCICPQDCGFSSGDGAIAARIYGLRNVPLKHLFGGGER